MVGRGVGVLVGRTVGLIVGVALGVAVTIGVGDTVGLGSGVTVAIGAVTGAVIGPEIGPTAMAERLPRLSCAATRAAIVRLILVTSTGDLFIRGDFTSYNYENQVGSSSGRRVSLTRTGGVGVKRYASSASVRFVSCRR